MVRDVDSEFHRSKIDIPGKEIEEGSVVMANFHGEEDDDGYGGNDTGSGFEGEGCGYPDDLITLTHLHEPAVVHCLQKRYESDQIYTSTGPILIALNPFKSCNRLYSDTVMRQYWRRGESEMLLGGSSSGDNGDGDGGSSDNCDSLPPHVYALADATYRSMMLKIDVEGSSGGGGGARRASCSSLGCDQSILVSGESGAGKTVTTKFIMQYLATLSERRAEAKASNTTSATTTNTNRTFVRKDSNSNVNIEQQVLQSNPILESFGNARTVRNDNSSRFGKFIEIRFNATGTLVSASIETYLLEKVRLISQSEGERNYHIFYEMLTGMSDEDLNRFILSDYTAEDFKMTSCSGTYDRRDGVQDTETYEELRDALEMMGFTPEQQNDVFSIAAVALHLSNLSINPIKGGEECEIDLENPHLEPVLQLLGVTRENLNQAICYFKIEARGQSYTRAVQKDKAEKGLEALIKATYSAMFDYIVKSINASITVKKSVNSLSGSVGRGTTNSGRAVIGVLDIFGFESFKTNSFEQLCINYCNEALQQQFNLFVLKNEQEEYEREGIMWSFISFPENQDVLDLIWKKGCGILNILDDQCRAPGTTDKTFANDLYQKLTGKPRFEANFRQVGARQFGVFHYAGLVEYDTDGFVEKNKDELPREAADLLLSSSSSFVKELASIISSAALPEPTKSARNVAGAKKSVTVGAHFSKQLQELRAKIDLTSPHYVRCLKPNGLLVPDHFDPLMIVEQLRCAGVVEAVRVSRVGYPQRYSHSQFVSRYRTLGAEEMKKAARSSRKVKPVEALINTIAKKMVDIESKSSVATTPTDKKTKPADDSVDLLAIGIQVGKTKVFLRRRAFDILEKLRKDCMSTAATTIQSVGRGYIEYRSYQEISVATLQLQCWCRIIFARQRVEAARECINSQRIQSAYRRFAARRVFLSVLTAAQWCQSVHRGALGRARYNELNRIRKAIVIESYWRSLPHMRRFQRMKASAVAVQCAVRCRRSRLLLKELKMNAKSLQNVAQERDQLRIMMEAMKLEVERAKATAKSEAEEAAKIMAVASSNNETELSTLREEVRRLNNDMSEIKHQLAKAQQSTKEATTTAEETKEELLQSRDVVFELEGKLKDAISVCGEKDDEIETLKLAMASMTTTIPQSASHDKTEELQTEVRALKKQLDSAIRMLAMRSSVPSEPADSSTRVRESQDEIKSLKDGLNASKQNGSSECISLSQAIEAKNLNIGNEADVKKLNREIAKLKDANKKLLETAEQEFTSLSAMEKENAELRAELENSRNSNAGSYSQMKKQLDEAKELTRAEATRAEEAITRETKLKMEIAELKSKFPQGNGRGRLMISQPISEEKPTDNIAALHFEIERLSNELLAANDATKKENDSDSADDVLCKCDDVAILVEEGRRKDVELERLKKRVQSQDLELLSLREEDLTFGTREYREEDADVAGAANEGLRSLNDELSKQIELYKFESDEAKSSLIEERKRSEMELKAFSVALRGVDDLRQAAEKMSRELHFIKRHGYVPPGGLSGVNTAESVKFAMLAVESMAVASQSIDHPSLAENPEQKGGFNLWNAMNAVVTPRPRIPGMILPAGVEPSKEESKAKKKSKDKRRRRKRGDDGSIISSFF